ncbi:MAG: hypothetical protein ABI192_00400 [Bradyrhizobium sp.]
MSDFSNFRAVYDELTDEVNRARYQFLPDHLRNWFEHIDDTPGVAEIVERLQAGQDFDSWYKQAESTRGSFVGSGALQWPEGKEKNLGMKLLMFRACAEKKLEAAMIGHSFIYVGNNINDNAHAVIEQLFMPMASELRRYLEREVAKLLATPSVPASDRVVSLDHNKPEYQEAVESLDRLVKTIRESNDYPSIEEKEQRIAEVSAARRLIDAVRVRVEPLVSLLRPVVIQFANELKDNLVTIAVSATIAALTALFGHIFG